MTHFGTTTHTNMSKALFFCTITGQSLYHNRSITVHQEKIFALAARPLLISNSHSPKSVLLYLI
jgi:hypothetical protein